MLRHPIVVYGIRENEIQTILHPICLEKPFHVYTYEAFNGNLLIPIYGVKCEFDMNSGISKIDEKNKQGVKDLFEKLVKAGKKVEIGFFVCYPNEFLIHYKPYFLE